MDIKPWYKTGWKIAGAVILFCIVIYIFLVGILSFKYVRQLNDGVQEFYLQQQISQYDFSDRNNDIGNSIETPDDPYSGPDNPALTIVEFYDYNCPHCRAFFPTIRRLSVEYAEEVKFILKDMPITSADSEIIAMASECAQDQGIFWEFHDKAFTYKDYVTENDLPHIIQGISLNQKLFYTCIQTRQHEKEVEADLEAGIAAGVTGTPTIFVNGHKISGEIPYDIFKKIIDTTLNSINN